MSKHWTPEMREAFLDLAYTQRLTVPQIAERLGLSETAVRQAKIRYPDKHPLGGVPTAVKRTPRTRRQVTLVFDCSVQGFEKRIELFVKKMFEKASTMEDLRRLLKS